MTVGVRLELWGHAWEEAAGQGSSSRTIYRMLLKICQQDPEFPENTCTGTTGIIGTGDPGGEGALANKWSRTQAKCVF